MGFFYSLYFVWYFVCPWGSKVGRGGPATSALCCAAAGRGQPLRPLRRDPHRPCPLPPALRPSQGGGRGCRGGRRRGWAGDRHPPARRLARPEAFRGGVTPGGMADTLHTPVSVVFSLCACFCLLVLSSCSVTSATVFAMRSGRVDEWFLGGLTSSSCDAARHDVHLRRHPPAGRRGAPPAHGRRRPPSTAQRPRRRLCSHCCCRPPTAAFHGRPGHRRPGLPGLLSPSLYDGRTVCPG